jgi:ABC-2 type transport system permease protein
VLADPALMPHPRSLALSRRWLADRRTSTLAWALSLFAIVAVQLSVYPAVKSQPGLTEMWDKLPEPMKAMFGVAEGLDFTSGPGYLRGEVFGFTLPLLFMVFGIGAGASAVAGDEEKGTLGLVLAQPVRRARVVIERFSAIVVDALVLAGAVLVSILVIGPLVGLHVGVAAVFAAVLATLLLSCLFASVALAAGAATGHRGVAVGAGAGLAVAG